MKDFFETQKHIIITLIVIIAITIISGYYASPQTLPIDENINEAPIPIEPASSEIVEKENDSLLQRNIPEVPIANGDEEQEVAQEEPQAPRVLASLILDGHTYSVSLPEQSSVYDLMTVARNMYDITFGGRNYIGLGFFIDEINGIKSNPGGNNKYWIYSINGKKADVGVSQYIVREGDIISWNYESR